MRRGRSRSSLTELSNPSAVSPEENQAQSLPTQIADEDAIRTAAEQSRTSSCLPECGSSKLEMPSTSRKTASPPPPRTRVYVRRHGAFQVGKLKRRLTFRPRS